MFSVNPRRGFLRAAGALALPAAAAQPGQPVRHGVYNVRDFGAAGDGARLDTRAIQVAIDACAAGGGGSVYFPPGNFLSGTLILKSRVRLYLETASVLLGSKNLADYPETVPGFRSYTDNYTDKSLLYGENLDDVSVDGRGTIDGQGAAFKGPYRVRPYMLRFVNCRGVAVSGITIRNSPMWVQHYLACDGVVLQGLTIHSRVNANNDGIDIDCCDRVRISDCDISSGDDAIVLKSTAARPCRNVAISNCVLSTACNALKLGTESNGGFENIAIHNCAIYDTRLAGIALEIVDGGTLDRVSVSNITMRGVGAPLFIRLGDRARPFIADGPRPPAGKLRSVIISDVQAAGASRVGCAIAGLPGHPIEDVTIENVRLVFEGGGQTVDPLVAVPEHPEKYPEHNMFGALPAYGFYCRHAHGLTLRGVRLRCAETDSRSAVICDDVDGLELSGCDLHAAAQPPLVLRNVRHALVHACRFPDAVQTSALIAGENAARISLLANDWVGRKPVDIAGDVPGGTVFLGANRSG